MVKKRDHPKIEELIERPWCYYCERDFDDARVLLSHQKAKHFRCNHCNRRLNTAGGLSVHLQQVHKETLTSVENAIEGREGVDPEIFGMCGVPEDLVNAHKQRIMNEYFKMEAERRARTGNPPPGTVTGEPKPKKAKIETPEELKARLAAHRAKRAAERANPGQSTDATVPVAGSVSPATTPENGVNPHSAPSNMPVQPPQFSPQFPPPHSGLPLQSPSGAGFPPMFPPQQPGHWPQNLSMPSFSPSQGPPFAVPPFMPPVHSPMTGQMSGSTVTRQPTRYSPVASVAPTPNTLPPAPGLPARPSFETPNFNREDMWRMHSGQAPAAGPGGGYTQPSPAVHKKPIKRSSDEISDDFLQEAKDGFKKEFSENAINASAETTVQTSVNQDAATRPVTDASSAPKASATPAEAAPGGKKKKNKSSTAKLVYNDGSESPEEKLAKQPRYAFKHDDAPQFVLGEVGAAVTGVAVDEDTVRDVQD